MIFEHAEKKALGNIRLSCHQLFEEANGEFEGRYLDEITILSTKSKVRQLHNLLRHSTVAQSTRRIRALHVHLPELNDLTIIHDALEDYIPSRNSTRRLLNAIPNLREFTLTGFHDGEDAQYRVEHEVFTKNQVIPTIFLSALGGLKPQSSSLTCLILDNINFDGFCLQGVLSTHSPSLRTVELIKCKLNGAQKRPATWDSIFEALHELELDDLFLSWLYDPSDHKNPLVLHERSFSNKNVDNWSSINPPHRAPPFDRHGTRHNLSDYEEDRATHSCAVFSQCWVDLRGSWVKKGINVLLGDQHHTLYPDPRDSEDIFEGWCIPA
jgi:hypothetical protein